MTTGARSTDRPLAFWLSEPADGPDPWSARDAADTDPAPPPVSGRYALIDPTRAAMGPPASRGRVCRQTDPCVVPPPGSDRMGSVEVEGRVAILPAPWAPVRGESEENKP